MQAYIDVTCPKLGLAGHVFLAIRGLCLQKNVSIIRADVLLKTALSRTRIIRLFVSLRDAEDMEPLLSMIKQVNGVSKCIGNCVDGSFHP